MSPQSRRPLPLIPQYRAAAIQYAPTLFEKEKNLLEQQEMVEEAARNEAKLIVMVEMATTAYCFYSQAEISPYVEPIPGPTADTRAYYREIRGDRILAMDATWWLGCPRWTRRPISTTTPWP